MDQLETALIKPTNETLEGLNVLTGLTEWGGHFLAPHSPRNCRPSIFGRSKAYMEMCASLERRAIQFAAIRVRKFVRTPTTGTGFRQ